VLTVSTKAVVQSEKIDAILEEINKEKRLYKELDQEYRS
jgi:hypothetical protein